MSRYAAKVTSKGQVTIPKALRERFGLQQGDYLVMEARENRIIATKAAVPPTDDFDDLADRIAERFEDRGISRDEVEDAIRSARRRSS